MLLICLGLFVSASSVAYATEVVPNNSWNIDTGVRYVAARQVSISNQKNTENKFVSASNLEPFVEWVPFKKLTPWLSWFGVEVSGQISDTTPQVNELKNNTVGEISSPTVTFKAHLFERKWINFSAGGGIRVNQVSGGSETYTDTAITEYHLDPITFVLTSVPGDLRTKYQTVVSGGGTTPVGQIDLNFPMKWGISLGVDAKITPGSVITVTKNTQTSVDGGPWTDVPDALSKVTVESQSEFAVVLAYSF